MHSFDPFFTHSSAISAIRLKNTRGANQSSAVARHWFYPYKTEVDAQVYHRAVRRHKTRL